MDSLDTLQTLVSAFGPSGAEGEISRTIEQLAAPWADEVTRDPMGNLICRKKGNGPKVMFAAHMDTLGLVVTHIEEDGYAHAGPLGGIKAGNVLYNPVKFQNGARAVICAEDGAKLDDLRPADLLLDLGVSSREEAEKIVKVGDPCVWDAPVYRAGRRLVGPYLDNRISCLVLLKAMKRLGPGTNDLYFVFTVQEEVGTRGAKTAAWGINPDYAIAVDVTPADDTAGSKHRVSSRCGQGAAVKIMDGSVICHPGVVKKLLQLGEEKGIRAQRDVMTSAGTDAGVIHTTRSGICTGGVSIPCRYAHTPAAVVDGGDVQAALDLITAFASAPLEVL